MISAPQPAPAADHSDMLAAAQRMNDASERIAALSERYAAAKCVYEFESDRRKAALSAAVAPLLGGGDSATAAEHKARASAGYGEAMRKLALQLTAALATMSEYEAEKIRFSCAQSLCAIHRSMMTNL